MQKKIPQNFANHYIHTEYNKISTVHESLSTTDKNRFSHLYIDPLKHIVNYKTFLDRPVHLTG